ncbi:MAG: DUF1801 domain-containing protein [Acidobacteria bacterium]|nr:DUF1801 domain-containing protein [Acidobacteriota bacterium]
MKTTAKTPDEYITALPDARREIISKIRETINANIPDGFVECMPYGMIGWAVPHSIYRKGYHVDPSKPLGLISLASQKSHIAIYHMGLYPGTKLNEWFVGEWPNYSAKKLDLGKSCLRFKKPEDVPLELIGKLATKLTPQAWVAIYEKMLVR